jgi:NTP pyrophosphatase (non-canonical NTP hydrolase)
MDEVAMPQRRQDSRGYIPGPRVFTEYEYIGPDIKEIARELGRVHDRFGNQSLTLFDWVSVLGEEYGELCRAVNEYEFQTEASGDLDHVYEEAIQVAAVAVHIAAVVREAP